MPARSGGVGRLATKIARGLTRSVIVLPVTGSSSSSHAQSIPPSARPGLGPGAVRVMVDANQSPWRGVVLVQTEIGLHCTGALIGPRVVLTAAHCLFGRGTGRLVRPSSVHVLTGYSHGDYAGHARAVTVKIGPGFAVGLDGQRLPSSPPDADWAVLTLDTSLGTADRLLPLARALPTIGTPAMLGGYEQDRAQVIVADVGCFVIGAVQDGDVMMLHQSCAGTRGVSGAPLLARVPGLGWSVVGIASVAGVGPSGGFAVPAAAIGTYSGALP